jgi:hypothetical protein
MSDVEDLHHVTLDRKQDPVDVRTAAIEQLVYLYRRISIFRSERAPSGKTLRELMAVRSAANQRSPASPASCERSQS